MLRLMLLRHAKTERDSPTGLDRDRPLAPRGHRDAPRMGAWMTQNGLVPDLALVSTAVRARQTWELVAPSLRKNVPTDLLDELYGADPGDLLNTARHAGLGNAGSPRSVVIVAHNPGLHEFALALVKSGKPQDRAALADNLPTGALVVIDADIDDWSDLGFQRGRLVRFMTPALLPSAT